jgi:hypothetical protein
VTSTEVDASPDACGSNHQIYNCFSDLYLLSKAYEFNYDGMLLNIPISVSLWSKYGYLAVSLSIF